MKIKLTVTESPAIRLDTGVIAGGGSGGVTDYNFLTGKPSINDVTLEGNKTNEEIGIKSMTNAEIDKIINSVQ